RVLAPLGLPLVVERNVVAWFDTTVGRAASRTAPPVSTASPGFGGSTARHESTGRDYSTAPDASTAPEDSTGHDNAIARDEPTVQDKPNVQDEPTVRDEPTARDASTAHDGCTAHDDPADRGAPPGRNAWSAADVLADPEARSRPAVDIVAGAGARSDPPLARAEDLFAPERFPVFVHEVRPGLTWYGFPDTGDGVKLGIHHSGESTDPETERREATESDVARIRELVGAYLPTLIGAHLPAAARPVREAAVCLYTNAPDDNFDIGPHPDNPAVIEVSACSGYGFTFEPVNH